MLRAERALAPPFWEEVGKLMQGQSVKKAMLVAALSAVLAVVAAAGPAAADDGGLRHYDFPKHDCAGAVPTHIDLYVHDWFRFMSGRMDGRLRYFSGQCVKAA